MAGGPDGPPPQRGPGGGFPQDNGFQQNSNFQQGNRGPRPNSAQPGFAPQGGPHDAHRAHMAATVAAAQPALQQQYNGGGVGGGRPDSGRGGGGRKRGRGGQGGGPGRGAPSYGGPDDMDVQMTAQEHHNRHQQQQQQRPATAGGQPRGGHAHADGGRPASAAAAPHASHHGPPKASFSGQVSQVPFESFAIANETKRAVAEVFGYQMCTLVQAESIPAVLAGKDVMAKAKTGSGKTLAFMIPAIQRMVASVAAGQQLPAGVKVLVLSPTRELASQIHAETTKLLTFHR